MKPVFIATRNYSRFNELCSNLLQTSLGLEMASVTGPAGRGKTTAAMRIATMNPDTVYVRFQGRLSPPALLREVAFALGAVRPRTQETCFEVIQTELEKRRKLLLLDEADRCGLKYLNILRDLHDVCSVPVVLIGEEPLTSRLRQERRLLSRVATELSFDPIKADDVLLFYRQALELPLSRSHSITLARRSGGDFRMMMNDCIRLERVMKVSGVSEITDKLLSEVLNGKLPNGNGTLRL